MKILVERDNPVSITPLYIGKGIEATTGYAKEKIEAGAPTLLNAVTDDDRTRLLDLLAKALDEKGGFEAEFKVQADSTYHWLHSNVAHAESEENGEVFDVFIRNITPEKYAREVRAKTLNLFESVVDGMLDAFYVLDCVYADLGEIVDFEIRQVNENACRQLGMKGEDLVGKRINELFPVNIENGFFDQYKKVFLTGETLIQEYEVPHEYTASGWYHQQVIKTMTGIAIINQDVSDDVNITLELKEQKKQLQDTYNRLEQHRFAIDQHAIVCATNIEGDITYVNDRFCAISGFSREELLGKNNRILNSGYHSREFFRDMFKTISSGDVFRSEIRNQSKHGKYYWMDTTIVPFKNPRTETIESYVSIQTDITERKLAEIDINESNLRFSVMAEAVNEAIWDWDIQNDVIYHSLGYERAFGHKSGHSGNYTQSVSILHPDDEGRVVKKLNDSLRSADTSYWEDFYRLRRTDGVYALVKDRGKILRDGAGKAYRMIGSSVDITKDMEYRQRIEDQNEKLRSIAWINSHKTRIPVANIIGLTTLLAKTSKPEEMRELAKIILESSEELDARIREVAHLSEGIITLPIDDKSHDDDKYRNDEIHLPD